MKQSYASPAGADKLEGYNAGFQEAIATYQDVIFVLFLTQLIQIFTHRLLHRDKPFSITINHPITGEELQSWGSDKQLKGTGRRIVKLIDNATFTLGMGLAGFLFVQIFFPAYQYEVTTRFN